MAEEAGTIYVTVAPKMASNFDSTIAGAADKAASAGGSSAGTKFGNTFAVFAGNILSDALGAVFSEISAHMDAAISRVDALNQFPRVMQNVGFSADEAEAAIARMADGIQGLPTTLDEIVGNTQSLAMSIGDLSTATDVAIALNDGFLMFGASSYQVSGAITQLNQMITAGKYDMQSWNSINQAAPGFLDTVARSMLGAESNAGQLRDALNDGALSSEDFLNAIVDLDQNGMEGFAAFSEGVKDATGGIETSMSRVDSAITRNLANIIDLAAETVGFSDICDTAVGVINSVGSAISDGLAWAFEYLSPYIEQAKGYFDDLVEALTPWFFNAVSTIAELLGQFAAGVLAELIMSLGFLAEAISKVIEFFKNFGSKVSEVMPQVAETIRSAISELPAKALQWGSEIVENLKQGILNKIGSLASAASEMAGTVASYIHFSEPDVGPLSNFHTYMPDMIQGMADDIRANMWRLNGAMNGLAGGISADIKGAPISNSSITINNLTVKAEDVNSAEQFVSMLRRAAVAYA